METKPIPYIEEISQEGIKHIRNAIRKYREGGHFTEDINFTKAIAGILETDIKHPLYQAFAIDNISQIIGIIIKNSPNFLAIKRDIEGKFFFQVDETIEEPYGTKKNEK